MVSEYEAAKLRREMETEMTEPFTILLRCAAGILIIVLLALVSPTLGMIEDVTANGGAEDVSSSRAAADL